MTFGTNYGRSDTNWVIVQFECLRQETVEGTTTRHSPIVDVLFDDKSCTLFALENSGKLLAWHVDTGHLIGLCDLMLPSGSTLGGVEVGQDQV